MKISEAQSNKEKAKRWMKNTALIAAGAGAGTGAGMLAERFAKTNIAPLLGHDPRVKAMVLGALAGGGSMAAGLLAKKLYEERKKRE